MKTKAISSIFVLFAIAAGMASMAPDAFANHPEVTVTPVAGSASLGCEETPEGCFTPNIAIVDLGGIVIFSNTDSAAHTFSAGTTSEVTGEFDTSMVMAGQSYEWTADVVGEIDYFCMVHPWMDGILIVQEAEEVHEVEVHEEEVEVHEEEVEVHEEEVTTSVAETEGGGCLIATATYGSEMALEVQQLRELRDNTLLNTESGTSFMKSFNDVYYSFSPIIADMQRENPVFKEMVKIAITPMISSLSILNYVDMNSESEVLGYGISLILLNLGMYLGVPAVVIVGIKKRN
jgi:plastocyanin